MSFDPSPHIASTPPTPGRAFSSTRLPALRQQSSTVANQRSNLDLPALGLASSSSSTRSSNASYSNGAKKSTSPNNSPSHNRKSELDATWIEMQHTLGEVERGGLSGGGNVFGQGHAQALEELRKAQIALAQAWARSETDDADADGDIIAENVASATAKTTAGNAHAGVLADDRAQKLGIGKDDRGKGRGGSVGGGTEKTKLEEETENDILLARQRRAANDRYFERVNRGVVDVVEKLGIVAREMRGLEMESKEIWGSDDTVDDESIG